MARSLDDPYVRREALRPGYLFYIHDTHERIRVLWPVELPAVLQLLFVDYERLPPEQVVGLHVVVVAVGVHDNFYVLRLEPELSEPLLEGAVAP